jgi:hypothetical protein
LLKGAGSFNKIKKINNKMFSYYRRIKKHRKLYEKTAKKQGNNLDTGREQNYI